MHRAYDEDPVAALTAALRVVLDRPGDSWQELIEHAALPSEWTDELRRAEVAAMDRLFTDLNELRTVGP